MAQTSMMLNHSPAQFHGLSGNPEFDVFEGGGGTRAGPGLELDAADVDIHRPRPRITLVHRGEQAGKREIRREV